MAGVTLGEPQDAGWHLYIGCLFGFVVGVAVCIAWVMTR